ncbi:integral membrane protein pth11 [Fusarium sp. NRRL 52700]|nr:integral membrane protein pth11 [Fusarium sp. NRRL 52700]
MRAAGLGGKGPMVVGVLWAENVVCYILIGLRLYTRRFIRGSIGWDDVCLVTTSALLTVFAILTSVSAHYGMGRHFDDLEIPQFADAMLWLLCAQSTVAMAIGMGKVAVAVFLLRIVTAPWHRWFLWSCIVSMMVLSTFLAIAIFAQCTPAESIWNPALIEQKVCHMNLAVVAFIDCAYAAVLDFALAGFPWIALRGLNMKRKERITICLSLSLGIFAGVCGVVRTSGLDALNNSKDYLYATSDSVIWTMSEVTTTLVCLTLPALRPLVNKMRGQESSSAGYRQHDDSNYGAGTGSYGLNSLGRKTDCTKSGKNNSTNVEAGHTTLKNDSDETILLQGGGKRDIMRVQEVSVSYENASIDDRVKTREAV